MQHHNYNQPAKRSSAKGFTIIELILAMTFFSSILIIATLVVVQMLNMYNKGIAIKQMNQVGRTLTDGIMRTANASSDGIKAETVTSCFKIGNVVYLYSVHNKAFWKIAGSPGSRINFAIYENQKECPTSMIDPSQNDIKSLVGDNVRIYEAVTRRDDSTGLLHFKFVLGTYDSGGNSNPQVDGSGNVTCQNASIGEFCAFSNFETMIYTPKITP